MIWSGRYDHHAVDALDLQSEVAEAVLQEIRPELGCGSAAGTPARSD